MKWISFRAVAGGGANNLLWFKLSVYTCCKLLSEVRKCYFRDPNFKNVFSPMTPLAVHSHYRPPQLPFQRQTQKHILKLFKCFNLKTFRVVHGLLFSHWYNLDYQVLPTITNWKTYRKSKCDNFNFSWLRLKSGRIL